MVEWQVVLKGVAEEAVVVECKLAKPRVVKCVGERILVMGDQGELVSYNTVTNKCSSLYKDSSLASYSLLEVDNDRVVMSGLTG